MSFAIPAGDTPLVPPTAAAATAEHRRLTDAAQQFEGMLLQELLKPMRQHEFCADDSRTVDGDQVEDGEDTLRSFGAEVMATAIAKAGGLGIAKRVVAQVEVEEFRDQKGSDTGRGGLAISNQIVSRS